jgi:hypothetical protein
VRDSDALLLLLVYPLDSHGAHPAHSRNSGKQERPDPSVRQVLICESHAPELEANGPCIVDEQDHRPAAGAPALKSALRSAKLTGQDRAVHVLHVSNGLTALVLGIKADIHHRLRPPRLQSSVGDDVGAHPFWLRKQAGGPNAGSGGGGFGGFGGLQGARWVLSKNWFSANPGAPSAW